MILSGLLFSFDKLNDLISTKGKVPIVADMMASRWAYEALAVHQFTKNSYEQPYYDLHRIEAQSDFSASFLVDEMEKRRKQVADNLDEKSDSAKQVLTQKLNVIRTTLKNDFYKKGLDGIDLNTDWTLAQFTPEFNKKLEDFLAGYKKFYQGIYNKAVAAREKAIVARESDKDAYTLNAYKDRYFSESLSDLVTNVSEKNRVLEYQGTLVQQVNPIFLDPIPNSALDYRAHFFAPRKNLFGALVSTYWFNVMVIWLMTVVLYITLYFELVKKLVNSFDKIPGKKKAPKVTIAKTK
jgi:ABC transport system ATP-binding/permease protein